MPPVLKERRNKMIFFKNTVSAHSENTIYFEAYENDDLIGKCTLTLEEKYAHVSDVTYKNGALYAAEGLLKSAFNYACLKNYYMGRCSAEGVDSLLERMGFYKKDGAYENDIPSILIGSCGSCNK